MRFNFHGMVRDILKFFHLTKSNTMLDDPIQDAPVEETPSETPSETPPQEAGDVGPSEAITPEPPVSLTPLTHSAQPLTVLTPASRPFTALTPSRPTRIGAVAADIEAANNNRLTAETDLQAVRDRINLATAGLEGLRSELAAAEENVVTAKQIEVDELTEAITILTNRRDTLMEDLSK